jgi:polar amino acid transport system substrate-binding protein
MTSKSGKSPPSSCRSATNSNALAVATLLLLAAGAAVHARTVQEIIDRHAFTICVHPDAPPFSARNPRPAGLQIDLGRAVAERLGVELREEWIMFRRDARQVGCDAVMGGVAQSGAAASARAARGPAMSRPYAAQVTRVVVRSGARPIDTLQDMRGRAVAVPHASLAHFVLDTKGIPVRTLYATDQEILEAVEKGDMEAGVVSEWSLGWYRKQHPATQLTAIDRLVIDSELDYDVAIALRDADRELVTRVDDILGDLMTNGIVARILGDYGIDYRPPMTGR